MYICLYIYPIENSFTSQNGTQDLHALGSLCFSKSWLSYKRIRQSCLHFKMIIRPMRLVAMIDILNVSDMSKWTCDMDLGQVSITRFL